VSAVLKITLALAAAAFVSACSALRLAYDNAHAYLHWKANNYLNLDDKAADELEGRIDAFLAWHRREELPRYVRISEEAARRMRKGLSREDLVWGYDSAREHAKRSLRAVAEQIAPMLDRLTLQQVAHVEKRFAEDNRRFAKENLRGSERERRMQRAKRVAGRLEDWVGRLSQAQIERVQQFAERAPLTGELRDRDRKRLQAELLVMLRAHEARKRLPERAANWEVGRDPAFVAANNAWREEFYAMLIDIDRSLSAEQRARAVAHFQRYTEDFSILAGRAGIERRAQ
jgi:hypothetical protein